MLNPHIDYIHMLVDPDRHGNWSTTLQDSLGDDMDDNLLRRKLRVHVGPPGRLKVADVLAYTNEKPALWGQMMLLANSDIYFDASLAWLKNTTTDLGPTRAYFLSRYEQADLEDAPGGLGTQCGDKFVGSHDSFLYVPPVPRRLVDRVGFYMGRRWRVGPCGAAPMTRHVRFRELGCRKPRLVRGRTMWYHGT